jgi:hypothetical protein
VAESEAKLAGWPCTACGPIKLAKDTELEAFVEASTCPGYPSRIGKYNGSIIEASHYRSQISFSSSCSLPSKPLKNDIASRRQSRDCGRASRVKLKF